MSGIWTYQSPRDPEILCDVRNDLAIDFLDDVGQGNVSGVVGEDPDDVFDGDGGGNIWLVENTPALDVQVLL